MMEPEQQTENADCVENADDEEIVEMKKRVEGMHDSSSLFLANTHSSSHHPNRVRDGERAGKTQYDPKKSGTRDKQCY